MEKNSKAERDFSRKLMDWHATDNDRSLPWKSEKDPYKIWLSEVILQQTRALQGLPYYLKFTETYPTIKDLAAANDDDVFRVWQGLGYYYRCRNMLATARLVANEYDGVFPADYEQILALKGIGPYTAAAIASFAFGMPYAVVDGNVYRVLSRYFRIDTASDSTEGKQLFAQLAQKLLNRNDSAGYNQAIMDLGATVCTPRNTQCDICPLQSGCIAQRDGVVELLPVKSKKVKVKTRHFNYLILHWQSKIWIHKRSEKDIWASLHEPLLVETDVACTLDELLNSEAFKALGLKYTSVTNEGAGKQRLTHQIIEANFFRFELKEKPTLADNEGFWVTIDQLKKLALPKTVLSFLENNLYF